MTRFSRSCSQGISSLAMMARGGALSFEMHFTKNVCKVVQVVLFDSNICSWQRLTWFLYGHYRSASRYEKSFHLKSHNWILGCSMWCITLYDDWTERHWIQCSSCFYGATPSAMCSILWPNLPPGDCVPKRPIVTGSYEKTHACDASGQKKTRQNALFVPAKDLVRLPIFAVHFFRGKAKHRRANLGYLENSERALQKCVSEDSRWDVWAGDWLKVSPAD